MENLINHFDRNAEKKLEGSLNFMIREWFSEDRIIENNDNSSDSEENNNSENKLYTIYIFGVNDKAESICLKINDFTPYFYVNIPNEWDRNRAALFVKDLKRSLGPNGKNLISGKIMLRKEAYGFNNNKQSKFIRLVFNTYDAYRHCTNKFKYPIPNYTRYTFNTFESSIDPMIVFIHLRNIQASGWISVDNPKKENRFSRCQHNLSCSWKEVNPVNENKIPPFVTMSFDIECYSFDGNFPLASCPENIITQIGSSFQRFGEPDVLKTVVVVGKCDPIEDVYVIECNDEKTLIQKWIDLICQFDPDQIIGYNIDDFDWSYIWDRAVYTDAIDYLVSKLPRLFHIESKFKKDTLSSNAYGLNTFNYITTPGIGQIDLLHWFRKNTKLPKYSLDYVSNKYLGDKKREITVQQIFDWSGKNASSKERSIVADYCAQDTLLPLRLMEDRCMFPNLVEMSRVTYVPFTWLITRGEQIKAYSQLSKELRKEGFVLPGHIKGTNDEYEGATVLNCERGIHFEPVSGLDFASLYPSIMIAWNMCPTTWVNKEKFMNLEGVEYKTFETEEGNHVFVQSVPGVIPGILDRLWKERKIVKKQMDIEKDPRMKAILNGKQLAIKVSMNSIYGFFGVSEGALPCRAIAASVTFTGRQMIKHSKECAESWYDGTEKSNFVKARVIYGDSVVGNTPLTIKTNNNLNVCTIENYFNSVQENSVDESYYFKNEKIDSKDRKIVTNDDMIMTKSGWRKIKRVIRHKCNKKLYRVTTPFGTVVVTEDHSLLNSEGSIIKPCDLVVNQTKLLYSSNFWM